MSRNSGGASPIFTDSSTADFQKVFAVKIENALDEIKFNTRQPTWISLAVCICLGLFLLAQLIRLRRDLDTLVRYQELFRRMWDDDKELMREQSTVDGGSRQGEDVGETW
ncbi:hypothetical protein GGS23DRAFT_601436 [Durotheca rogersii]|uniref:uncharacterized protein n=1 Tax=Durotheca rogersii TaxID=419775 RepID=UPI00221ECC2F|nr:uncharacterized protein GGS23DRAFT_601436 [Durotheca rogersii]KAI5855072.1 hypothetical protein GGS23DRAFT_601436 [Durotheca rogersii]